MLGMERQPSKGFFLPGTPSVSSLNCLTISGLINTRMWDVSLGRVRKIRKPTPIWVAASPTPFGLTVAISVFCISVISLERLESNSVTCFAGVVRTGWGTQTMGFMGWYYVWGLYYVLWFSP